MSRKFIEPIKTKTMLITQEQLSKICPTLKGERLTRITDLLNELCPKYGITEPLPFKMFLANVAQESGEFAHKEENMNYRAERILQVWPTRFHGLEDARLYEHNQIKLANKVYGGRMGNVSPNDGYQFKGGGFIGITGRELYTKYAKHIGRDITLTSDMIRTSDRYALDSACWFFAVLKNLIPVAKTGNFINVVRGINGGEIGLRVRLEYYDRVKNALQNV